MRAILSTAVTALLFALPITANAQGWPGGSPAPLPAPSPYGGSYQTPYTAPYGGYSYGGSAYGGSYGMPYAAPYGFPAAGVNLSGIWYMNGEQDKPTRIIQYGPGRALFINEHGSQAWGSVRGNRVWIPDWTWGEGWNTHQGLWGTLMGNRLVWPDGSFWVR